MKEFEFAVDRKVKMWVRDKYIIEAETYEDAVAKMTEEFKHPQYQGLHSDPGFQDPEELDGTEEEMSVNENYGQPTRQLIYIEGTTGKKILDNTYKA